jgi:hypothetical protein
VEHLGRRLQLVLGQTEHVEVLGPAELHLPDGIGGPDRLELVPQHRGPLEIEGL